MTGKETIQRLFFSSLRVAMVFGLALACLLPCHAARAQYGDNDGGTGNAISPHDAEQAFGSRWREVLESYKEADERFLKKQQERLKTAQPIAFSEKKKVDQLIKTYPFLKKDIDFARDTQKTTEDYLRTHPSINLNPSTHFYVSENISPDGQNNLLFLEERGSLSCSAHGCPITIYVGSNNQYATAMNYIGDDNISVARTNGQVSLFFDPQTQIRPVEWVLKNNIFVQNPPPPTASQAPAYLQWLHKQQKTNNAPVQNNTLQPSQQPSSPWGALPSSPEQGSGNDTIVPATP